MNFDSTASIDFEILALKYMRDRSRVLQSYFCCTLFRIDSVRSIQSSQSKLSTWGRSVNIVIDLFRLRWVRKHIAILLELDVVLHTLKLLRRRIHARVSFAFAAVRLRDRSRLEKV